MASLGRVIIVSNSAVQKKTSSPFDWFGHLLDSIHPITSLAAALVGSKVDPVMKHANNVLPSLKLTATSPKSMVGWNFLRQKKAYLNRANLLLASGMVISSRCWGILHAPSETRLHSYLQDWKEHRIDEEKTWQNWQINGDEMRWYRSSKYIGKSKKTHPQKKLQKLIWSDILLCISQGYKIISKRTYLAIQL